MTQEVASSPSNAAARSAPGQPIGPQRELGWRQLTDVIDLALWIGKLLLEHGAAAPRVEQTVALIGGSLGCDQLDILVSPNVVMATTTEGQQFRTKARRVAALHVDLARLVALDELATRVAAGTCDRFQLREALGKLEKRPHGYPRPVVALAVGLACAAFSRLSGGDLATFAAVLLASSSAAAIRHVLNKRRLNPILIVLLTAFSAATIASLVVKWLPSATPAHALAASVLLLVPGVPLINAFDELVRGYSLIAVARGVQGLGTSIAIALGLLLAMQLTGVAAL